MTKVVKTRESEKSPCKAFLLAGPMSPLIHEVEQRYTFVYIQHTRFVNVTPIMKNLI